jgi:ubiquinone/menaquinone biosynthesis C-methylase UbiE
VQKALSPERTAVDAYWGQHTVNSVPFRSRKESLDYLEWRFEEYPLFRELMELYGDHAGETVLDYGCGPGNDVVGFLEHSRAARVIGVDISEKALGLAQRRLALHGVDPRRVRLIQLTDADSRVPLPDGSVDYVYCEGVLQHTSRPGRILGEFHRILRAGGCACVMVYNIHSIWRNLYTAYEKRVIEGQFAGLTLDEAFARNTDGPECPIARCYRPEEFGALGERQGFRTTYRGGYLARHELRMIARYAAQAVDDPRLPEEQRAFLRDLTRDEQGFPMYQGKYAGVGGVYHLRKGS